MNDPTQDAEAEEIARRERQESGTVWLKPNNPKTIAPGVDIMLLQINGTTVKIAFDCDPRGYEYGRRD